MLVLTRKPGEAVIINNTIKVHILGTGTQSIRLGFDCDKSIRIVRAEVYTSIANHNQMAQNMNIGDYEGVKVLWKKTKKALK